MLVDGGVIFAGQPRFVWENLQKPDIHNRVEIGVNQLLVRGNGICMLVDTGIGDKFLNGYQSALSGIENNLSLAERLREYDVTPEDVTHVVFTHLHFDHCGGATERINGNIVPVFRNADYFVQMQEWEDAVNPDEISRMSYCIHNLLPLSESHRLHLISGDVEIAEGIFAEVTGGHTNAHQMVTIEGIEKKVIFCGDICPTPHHIALELREAVGVNPMQTLMAKKKLIKKALQQDSYIAFSHSRTGDFYRLKDYDTEVKAVLADES